MTIASGRPAASLRIGFVKFVVQDLDAMTRFYARALGLVPGAVFESDAMIERVMRAPGESSSLSLVLYHYKDERTVVVGSGHGPLGCFVPDVDAACAHAIREGARPHRTIFDTPTLRVGFVLDPEGREIEFLCPLV